MKYIAAVDFIDLKDGKRFYEKGESWPREGLKPTKKRVEELLTADNAAGFPLIEAVEEKDPENQQTPGDEKDPGNQQTPGDEKDPEGGGSDA